MTNKSVAIILLNWNNSDYTVECIKSLFDITYLNKKIIVVDNASTDKSIDNLKQYLPKINIITNEKNLGFTGGNNVGIKMALNEKFDFIMLLNNDTIVDKAFLEPLLSSFEFDTAAVQPLILNYHNKETIWNCGGHINKTFGIFSTYGKNKSIKSFKNKEEKFTEWISGCCFMIRSSAVNEVGLLDDEFFVYFEDVDWSLRLRSKDYKLKIIHKIIIYHHEGVSWKNKNRSFEGTISPYTHYLNIRNHILILKKHLKLFNPIGVFLYQLVKISSYLIYFLIRFRFNKFKMVLRGFVHAMKFKK